MSSTNSIGEVLQSTSTTCTSRFKSTSTTSSLTTDNQKQYSYECDDLYDQLSDLVNKQFRMWFLNHFYRLGREKVIRLAVEARVDGKHPPRYFTKLLKNAV